MVTIGEVLSEIVVEGEGRDEASAPTDVDKERLREVVRELMEELLERRLRAEEGR